MRVFFIICAIIFIIVCIIGIGIFFIAPKNIGVTAAEKNAVFTKILGRQPLLTAKLRSNGWVSYDGTYSTFNYPKAATQYPDDGNVTKSNVVIENFEFQEKDPRYHFVFQVVQQPDAKTYDDISGVSFRRANRDQYAESSINFAIEKGIGFVRKSDSFEKTAFLLIGGKLFTFSITGSDPGIERIFDEVVKSMKIK